MTSLEFSASAALKEWALVCQALAENRQIFLLRKGGLLDEDGTFQLEHREFLLLPTWLHQEKGLVRPEHRDLFDTVQPEPDENAKTACFRHFARVEKVWAFGEDDAEKLEQLPQIWSRNYLDLRFGYKPEKPLLCAAVRLYALDEPQRYALRPEDTGCRSWVEWDEPRQFTATPLVSGNEFNSQLTKMEHVFG